MYAPSSKVFHSLCCEEHVRNLAYDESILILVEYYTIFSRLVKFQVVSAKAVKITVRSIFPGQVQVKDANKQKMKKK